MCIMRLLDVGGTNLAQWRHKMPIYYGWRWHGMLTTERQQYSENPGGVPRQCISVCPWKLAQPIAGYRRNTRLILNPQWHKRLHAAYFYFLFVLALFAKYLILFSRITGIRHLTWLVDSKSIWCSSDNQQSVGLISMGKPKCTVEVSHPDFHCIVVFL